MSEFQTVAKVGDIPEGQGRSVPCNGTMVGVFLHEGEYFAINDFCPHMGASLSDSPVAEDGSVMCSWHAWCFSIKDGTWLDNSKSGIRTPCYDVRVQGNEIQVRVPDPDAPSAGDSSGDAESPADDSAKSQD
jgi:nitrite reductase (NADH) small subunit/3-phenylpropionate/trans-cinnamate dioxygenase ferredoxin subunit